MVIITGMDNTGKTTLCQELSERSGVPIIKSPGPHLTTNDKKLWVIEQLAREKAVPNLAIYDRFMPFEEMVYGKVLRGECDFDLDDLIMKELFNLNPTILYTRVNRNTALADNGRSQMKGVMENGEKLLAGWDELYFTLKGRGWNIESYDWQTDSIPDESLEDMFERSEEE